MSSGMDKKQLETSATKGTDPHAGKLCHIVPKMVLFWQMWT